MFHQRIKSWIFLKSTQKGLLKNVQDGISRPLGSREIQKTKVGTILRDTLYKVVFAFDFCQNPTLTQLNSTQLKATLRNLG